MRLNSDRIPAQILKSGNRDTERKKTPRFKWKMQILKDIDTLEHKDEQSASLEKFWFGHLMRLNSDRIPAQILTSGYRDTQRRRRLRLKWKMQDIKPTERFDEQSASIDEFRCGTK